jgi:hypothetical protein
VVAGLALIGWVARTTSAQKTPQKSAVTLPSPDPFGGEVKALATEPGSPLPPTPVGPALSELEPLSHTTPSAGESEDPEKNVQAFVEQNRKVAETQLKNLRDEAEKLRARLQKVEAGIRRWDTLLTALQASEVAPEQLEPIPQARRGFNAAAVPRPPAGEEPASPRSDPGSDKPAPARDVEPRSTPPPSPR